jgi:hypothetical protein
MICRNAFAPPSWIAAVTGCQASTCAVEKMPGIRGYPSAFGDGAVPSVMMRPAVLRWR